MAVIDTVPVLPFAGALAGTELVGIIDNDGLPAQATVQAIADLAVAAAVDLQATTPGTAETGNFNVTGTGIMGVLSSTTAGVTGALTAGTIAAGTATSPVAALNAKGAAGVAITGTTTANGTLAITGVGTLFTTELAVGDQIALSSAATTFFTVTSIESATALHLTGYAGAGDGTSQTLARRPRIAQFTTNAGAVQSTVNTAEQRSVGAPDYVTRVAGAPSVIFERTNGTAASPTGMVAGNVLGVVDFNGWDTAVQGVGSLIGGVAGATWSTTDHESYLQFQTTPSGSASSVTRLTLRSDGKLGTSTAYASGTYVYADASNVLTPYTPALSTEITANGSPQNFAHGLGITPRIVIVTPTDTTAVGIIAGGFATSWTADATNVAVTASNTLKYRVMALP